MTLTRRLINPWEQAEIDALTTVPCYDTLLQLALRVLERMKGMDVVQVCGAMSTGGIGDLDLNMRRFEIAVDVLHESGHAVFDQTPFQIAMKRISAWKAGDPYDMRILETFYAGIFKSGIISKALFLPLWETSFGARWERRTLTKHQIPIADYPEDLFVRVIEIESALESPKTTIQDNERD